jgi:glyoxylase-like metal-dependent hydrolase (beta-lactamase superfamily II)
MELYKLEAGNFMLDGGAMFGVVPKSMWSKVYEPNENNLCNLATRCLLVVDGDKKILIDTGLGNKQDDKFWSYYFLNGDFSLESSLQKTGYSIEDITDVVLTHLHFDHVGGAVVKSENDELKPLFKNATYHISKPQWAWAEKPNRREKASFLKENIQPLIDHKVVSFFEDNFKLSDHCVLSLYNGHTQGLAIPFIKYKGRVLVFMADLIPTAAHIPMSWVCGYDTQPLVALEEKEGFLNQALMNRYTLFFEHDINVECCTLKQTEKGIKLGEVFTLEEFKKSSN